MPKFTHNPVMVAEILEAVRPKPGQRFVDGTVGGGGHAEAILKASSPTGWLYGCDRDGAAVEAVERRLAPYVGRFEIRRGNFAELADWIEKDSCDAVLLDLGVSSPQLDEPGRGFSFQQDGPLDMRMDQRQPLTAAELVNGLSESELTQIFRDFGEEPRARRFAQAIVGRRRVERLETTGQLAGLIERLAPRRGRTRHPATRVFQALRAAVNNENSSLRSGLAVALSILKPHGTLAVITFHSGEDRIVKEFARQKSRDYKFEGPVDVPALRQPSVPHIKWARHKAIQPSPAEVAANPRARSAQLRVMEKI